MKIFRESLIVENAGNALTKKEIDSAIKFSGELCDLIDANAKSLGANAGRMSQLAASVADTLESLGRNGYLIEGRSIREADEDADTAELDVEEVEETDDTESEPTEEPEVALTADKVAELRALVDSMAAILTVSDWEEPAEEADEDTDED